MEGLGPPKNFAVAPLWSVVLGSFNPVLYITTYLYFYTQLQSTAMQTHTHQHST